MNHKGKLTKERNKSKRNQIYQYLYFFDDNINFNYFLLICQTAKHYNTI